MALHDHLAQRAGQKQGLLALDPLPDRRAQIEVCDRALERVDLRIAEEIFWARSHEPVQVRAFVARAPDHADPEPGLPGAGDQKPQRERAGSDVNMEHRRILPLG